MGPLLFHFYDYLYHVGWLSFLAAGGAVIAVAVGLFFKLLPSK